MRESKVRSESVDLTDETDILNTSEPSSKTAEALSQLKKEEGNKLFLQGSFAEAAKLYTEAIGLCAQPAYYTNRSQCSFKLGNYEAALDDANSAVQSDPKFGKGYLRIAGCNIVFGNFESARRNLKLAEQNTPDPKGISEIRKESARLERLCKQLSESEKCWQKEDWRGVVYYANQVIEAAPKLYSLVTKKAEALVYNKKVDEALNLMTDVLRMDDKNVDALFVRGLCFYYQDNLDKGSTHFKEALRLSPDHQKSKSYWSKVKDVKSKKETASVLLKSGKVREALVIYTEALNVDPSNDLVNSKIHFNIAVCHSKLKAHKQALDSLNAALSLEPGYVKAGMKRVQVYIELEMFEDAAREAENIYKREKSQNAKTLLDDAKLALKKSKQKDYYKILGVGKDASQDDIKKAYKKKALVHHPDRHANSTDVEKKDNEKKFKDLGEAYAVLSDKTKKMRYDSGQDSPNCNGDFGQYDASDIFASFFAGGGHPGFGMGGQTFSFATGGGGQRQYQNAGGFSFQ